MDGDDIMNISETIRKYRKKLGMTQEQMATKLGVSAPAVNKWENGISYPDITILAPLARILGIDVNELLSFHEELSENEMALFINQMSANIIEKGVDTAFLEAQDLINQYPNCNKLILWSAQVLNGYLVMKPQEVEEKSKYENLIRSWFKQVAFCDDVELAKAAQMSLAQSFIRDKQFDEAQKLLDKIPPVGFDKRVTQAQLYTEMEQYDSSYQELEAMLYQQANGMLSYLMQILSVLCREKKYDEALRYADISEKVSKLFELGSYSANASYFTIYAEQGNKELTIDALEKMMEGFDSMYQVSDSELYQHMKFKPSDGMGAVKEMLIKAFDNDPAMDFIRNEPRFIELYKKYVK